MLACKQQVFLFSRGSNRATPTHMSKISCVAAGAKRPVDVCSARTGTECRQSTSIVRFCEYLCGGYE